MKIYSLRFVISAKKFRVGVGIENHVKPNPLLPRACPPWLRTGERTRYLWYLNVCTNQIFKAENAMNGWENRFFKDSKIAKSKEFDFELEVKIDTNEGKLWFDGKLCSSQLLNILNEENCAGNGFIFCVTFKEDFDADFHCKSCSEQSLEIVKCSHLKF